ncbi:MAG: DUF7507 domain-containing protein, partial [Rhodanobacteraceae bacterium]
VDNAAPNIGDTVTFTITAHDNGPNDATGVVVTDLLPAGLGFVSATPSQGAYSSATGLWNIGTLTSGGSTSTATLTIVATVTATGALTNTATVTLSDQPDPNSTNDSASASLNGNPLADLAVTKSGPASVTPGDPIVYTIVVTNNGPSDATNVFVADATPAGLVFTGNAGACATPYPCTIATLASGASATITTTMSVPANYTGPSPIVNTASATSDTPDPDNTNNQGSANTMVGPGNADLSIVKQGPASVPVGNAVIYALIITNNGPSPANGATYNDDIPADLALFNASCGNETGGAACVTQPVIAGHNVSGTIGTLPSGGSVIVNIFSNAPAFATTISNTATVAPPAGITDPDPADNASSVDTEITGGPTDLADLSVVKSGPANAMPGANVTYTLTVTNAGPETAVNTILADVTPAGLTYVSASMPCGSGFPCGLGDMPAGASTIVTVTFAVPIGATNTILNTATVLSETADTNVLNNTSSVSTPIVPVASSADLAVIKTGPASVDAGTSATYTLSVTNNGPDAATNAVLVDPAPAGTTFASADAPCAGGFPCALGTLASGQNVTLTATFAVDANASGNLVNTASIGSDTSDPNSANNTSSVGTSVNPTGPLADLVVVKTGPANVAPGGNVTYTIQVTNNGPDAAVNTVLADTTPSGLSFVAADAPCAGGFPCALGTLASGQSVTLAATYAVDAGASGTLVNTANVASDTSDPSSANNTSSIATTVIPSGALADLVVLKTGPANVVPGGSVTYTIQITNNGPDAAVNTVLADTTPPGLSFVIADAPCDFGFPCALGTLASGQSVTLSATYRVEVGARGTIVNTASVASETSDPDAANSSSTAVATVIGGGPGGEPALPVPIDTRWMLLLLVALLGLAGVSGAGRSRS